MNLIDQVYRELALRGPATVAGLSGAVASFLDGDVRVALSELEQLGDVVPDPEATPTRWMTSEFASHLQQMAKYGVADEEPQYDDNDEPYLRDVPFWER